MNRFLKARDPIMYNLLRKYYGFEFLDSDDEEYE
jgi:hypothetical protein